MTPFRRFFWLITALVFLSGCSGYHRASLPRTDPTSATEEGEKTVQEGSEVKVELVSGEKVSGKIVQISDEALVLMVRVLPEVEYPFDSSGEDYLATSSEDGFENNAEKYIERTIPLKAIDSLKVKGSSAVKTVFLCLVIGFLGALIGAGISVSANGVL